MRILVLLAVTCIAVPVILLTKGEADQGPVQAPVQSAHNRKPAPDFHLLDTSGKPVTLSDYRGNPLLLNLWATECGGCRAEIPAFIALEKGYKDMGLNVVGISMDIMYEGLNSSDEGWDRVRPFIASHNINYRILMGDNSTTTRFDVQALPATWLIDRHGLVVAVYVGVADAGNLETNVKKVLAEP